MEISLILSIFSSIVSIISLLSIHLRSNCCNNICSFDILNADEYKMEHENEHNHNTNNII